MSPTSEPRAVFRSRDQPRFVVLYHRVGPQLGRTSRSHFDWMFQLDRTLRTWATSPIDSLDRSIEVGAQSLADHRLKYLDHEGAIAGDRGCVERVISGTFELCENAVGCFSAQLAWQETGAVTRRARLSIQRNRPEEAGSEAEASWRLRLEPCG